MKTSKRTAARGFSMIEMLVGILIVSFGLLGLITLQARALQVSVSSEDSQRAALLANEMASLMLNANTINVGSTDLAAWVARAADPASGGLPGGVGTVTVTNTTTARVTLTWTPVQSTGAANDTHTYTTDVVIPLLVAP